MSEKEPKQTKKNINEVKKDIELVLVFSDKENKLYKQDLTARGMNKNSIATFGGSMDAIIDSKAYEILENKCAGNKDKLNSYLKAILYFELRYSDDFERHQKRLPIEEEILILLREGGYFV